MEIVIDRNRCEGKADCVRACPERVFRMAEPDPKELGWLIKLKLRFHGGKQVFAVAPEKCNGCNKCVQACPEKAISVNL